MPVIRLDPPDPPELKYDDEFEYKPKHRPDLEYYDDSEPPPPEPRYLPADPDYPYAPEPDFEEDDIPW